MSESKKRLAKPEPGTNVGRYIICLLPKTRLRGLAMAKRDERSFSGMVARLINRAHDRQKGGE